MIINSFGLFMLLFVIIGVLSTLRNQRTNVDYLIASRDVKPWMVGLSAMATANSGYMFVGVAGFSYLLGLSVVWMVFWLAGDITASLFIHRKLREVSERNHSLSFTEALSSWGGADYRLLRMVGGLMTVIFLSIYAAAQLNAGSKAMQVIFGWDHAAGAILGAVIVLLYCFAGGIRASIWTDTAQALVMLFAMGLLFFVAMDVIGGADALIEAMRGVSPTYAAPFPAQGLIGGALGPMLFIAGWMFAGFGVVGQPHIMVRFMAIKDPQGLMRARLYYYTCYVLLFLLAFGTGLCARILLPEVAGFDRELAMPMLARQLLPDILVGLMLAGVFAATISTADSQILSCTAAITRDFTGGRETPYMFTKLATVAVTMTALSIALWGNQGVFQLVLVAWATLACAFAPLLSVYALGGRPSQALALTMMGCGVGAMFLWRHWNLHNGMYEAAPGIIAGLLPYFVARLISKLAMKPSPTS